MSKVDEFFINVRNTTNKALQSPSHQTVYQIQLNTLSIELNICGESLASLFIPALKHLLKVTNKKVPDYRLTIWDSKTTGVPLPFSPVNFDKIKARGEIEGLNNNRFNTAYFGYARMLSIIDFNSKEGYICLHSTNNIPAFEIASPFRAILSWIFRKHSSFFLHAGAVSIENKGLLLVGKSGSGKSTTALKCLLEGFNYLGDDLCGISFDENGATAHRLFSSGKSMQHGNIQFQELDAYKVPVSEFDYDKNLFILRPPLLDYSGNSCTISGIVLPEVSTGLPVLEPVPRAKIMQQLVISTQQLLPDAGTEIMEGVSLLLKKTPCFKLRLGNDICKVPPILKNLIEVLAKSVKHE